MLHVEREMGNLQGQYRLVEQNYGQDVLTLGASCEPRLRSWSSSRPSPR